MTNFHSILPDEGTFVLFLIFWLFAFFLTFLQHPIPIISHFFYNMFVLVKDCFYNLHYMLFLYINIGYTCSSTCYHVYFFGTCLDNLPWEHLQWT